MGLSYNEDNRVKIAHLGSLPLLIELLKWDEEARRTLRVLYGVLQ